MKITNSRVAYYDEGNGKGRVITTTDALKLIHDGVSLRGSLYDVQCREEGRNVRVKYVYSSKKRSYFAVSPETTVRYTRDLVGYAKEFISGVKYNGIHFGRFSIPESAITDVNTGVALQCALPMTGDIIIVKPDIVVSTPFMDFYIELGVADRVWDDVEDYKLYRQYGDWVTPFVVFRIDLRDLEDEMHKNGWKSVASKVDERLLYNSDYKTYVPVVSLKLEDAPFGWSKRTGLPYKLSINTHADSLNPQARDLILSTDSIVIKYIEDDAFHSLYLTDDSPEHPMYPLHCPIHTEEPLRMARQAASSRGAIFFKCALNHERASRETSECDLTLTFCDKAGNLEDEFLITGNFLSFLNGDEEVLERIKLLRACCKDFRGV